jgi:hypothetical protein
MLYSNPSMDEGCFFWLCGAETSKKVRSTRVKALRARGFAGMLPRTMSPGNDALPPKDAKTAPSAEASAQASASLDPESTAANDPADDEGDAKRNSTRPSSGGSKSSRGDARSSKTESDEASDERDSDQEAREQQRSRKRSASGSSRNRPRDDDDDDQQLPPQTEEEINVPKMQTVYMLGAMSALTIVLWFAAKLTCNVHPDQVREPKHFSTKDLAADPKNAAYEFHHNYETGDFTTAFDLATGEMRRIVENKLKECEQNPDDCAKSQRKLAGTIESTGKVLDRGMNRATVELTSYYRSVPNPKVFAFEVVREGEFWRVASRRDVVAGPPQVQQAPAAATGDASAPVAPVEMPDQPAPAAP